MSHSPKPKNLAERLDGWIEQFSPSWALNRRSARMQLELQTRFSARMRELELDRRSGFEGANGISYSDTSDASLLEESLHDLQITCADLVRNNCYAASLVKGRVDNVIGNGISPQSLITELPEAGFTTDDASKAKSGVERLWERYADRDSIWIKQRLNESHAATFGEILCVVNTADPKRNIVPLTLTPIRPSRLDTPPDKIGDPNVRMGIEFETNEAGERVPKTYYIRKVHRGDSRDVSEEYIPVPANRVYHVFEQQFEGQIRGIPWLAPVMKPLEDIKMFSDYHMAAQKYAASYVAIFKTTGDPLAQQAARIHATDARGKPIERIEGNQVYYTADDQDVVFADPKRPGNTFGPFIESNLRGVAAGTRYPYALLAKKYDNSYSGGRLELIDGMQSFGGWHKLHSTGVWKRYFAEWWLPKAVASGLLEDELDEMLFYAHRDHFTRNKWSTPRRPWIDPKVEVESHTAAIEKNIGTEHRAAESSGEEWEDIRDERLLEKKRDADDEAALVEYRTSLGLDPTPPNPDHPQPQQAEKPDADEKPPAKKPKGKQNAAAVAG